MNIGEIMEIKSAAGHYRLSSTLSRDSLRFNKLIHDVGKALALFLRNA